MSIEKNNHRKEKGIKIKDPERIDYTFTGKDDPLIHQVNQKQKKRILTGYGLISQRIQRLGLKEG